MELMRNSFYMWRRGLFHFTKKLWTLDENGGPQGGYKWARIVIFWDIENCKVPSDCKAAHVREKILRSLWDLGLDTLNTTVKQASDESINRRIGRWMAVTPGHVTLLLITGDKDFALTLRKVERAGYNTILAYDHGNKSQLLEYVGHYQFTWRGLLQLF
ncbi:hypothetical protein F2Q69_00038219 [Brassica cretica]|uniref:NYN domain-containing protein n=1 Tax=Brassica cretica TaxID=69181 RepID=A0A8S9SGX1_BRACR|nr:hypothetical protein F2Q69_00038219 [Brassica cretica]